MSCNDSSDVDGMLICYKVSTIPESYGRLRHSQSTDLRFTIKNLSWILKNVSKILQKNLWRFNNF